MSNKNPTTKIVNIPSKFYPLLQREMDERGLFAYVELMNQILTEHYQQKGWSPAANGVKPAEAKEIIKGGK
ncbi:hypothetical protein ES705_16961 [subsurface metagenome]